MLKIQVNLRMNRVFILSTIVLFLLAGTLKAKEEVIRFEFEHQSMGTLFRIVCYSEDKRLASRASQEAFERIDQLNLIMSDYLPDSELNILCRQSGSGEAIPVSKDLFNIISESLKWSEISAGTFDITVGAYSKLWRRAGRTEEFPGEERITMASEKVGSDLIVLDSVHQTVLLSVKGMHLDLGGIAKGFAVDEAYKIFMKYKITRVLVDGGGDIRAGESPTGKDGWKIVIESKEDGPKYIMVANQSVATSGDLYRFVEIDGQRYSHIIDPFTGYGVKIPRVVTTISDNCTKADVLASILSIMGPVKGFEFLTNLQGVNSIIVQNEEGIQKNYVFGNIDIRE